MDQNFVVCGVETKAIFQFLKIKISNNILCRSKDFSSVMKLFVILTIYQNISDQVHITLEKIFFLFNNMSLLLHYKIK